MVAASKDPPHVFVLALRLVIFVSPIWFAGGLRRLGLVFAIDGAAPLR
jgi:hypothetical protein